VAWYHDQYFCGAFDCLRQIGLGFQAGRKLYTFEVVTILPFPGQSLYLFRFMPPEPDIQTLAAEQDGERGPPGTRADDCYGS
jgi:hypothetical protein